MNRLKIERVGRRGQWVAGPGSRHVDAISSYVEILPLRPNTADERTDTSRAGKGHKLNICIVENRRKIDPVVFFFFWIFEIWKVNYVEINARSYAEELRVIVRGDSIVSGKSMKNKFLSRN